MGDQRSSFYEHVHNLISGEQYTSKLITQSKNLCDGLPCEVTDKPFGSKKRYIICSKYVNRKMTNLGQRKIRILLYIFGFPAVFWCTDG